MLKRWKFIRQALPPVVGLCLLSGLTLERRHVRASVQDSTSYHATVAALAQQIPYQVGDWFGTDCPVPPAAVALLHPNVIVSRQYQNVKSGHRVSLLLVQCADARDILGHYPPVCYAGHGWSQLSARELEWRADDLVIQGMRYEFSSTRFDRVSEIVIDNFMLLPDGRTCRDMEGVDRMAQDRRKRYFGAAQFQILADASVPSAVREELMQSILRSNKGLIQAISRGANQ